MMAEKQRSTGRYITISPKGGKSSGAFIERVARDGSVVKSMNGKVFEGARSAANSKLREVSGKFLVQRDAKKK